MSGAIMGALTLLAAIGVTVYGTRGERRLPTLSELDVYRRCYAHCGRHPCER